MSPSCAAGSHRRRHLRRNGRTGPGHRPRPDPQPAGGLRQPRSQRPLDLPLEGPRLRRRGVPPDHQDRARRSSRPSATRSTRSTRTSCRRVLAYRVDESSPASPTGSSRRPSIPSAGPKKAAKAAAAGLHSKPPRPREAPRAPPRGRDPDREAPLPRPHDRLRDALSRPRRRHPARRGRDEGQRRGGRDPLRRKARRPPGRAPWRTSVDFGRDLAPHELVARGSRREGPRGRARPPVAQPAAASRGAPDPPPARRAGRRARRQLAWESLFGAPPTSVRVTFDGRPPRRPRPRGLRSRRTTRRRRTCSRRTSSSEGFRGRADSVLGGRTWSEAASELTGVPSGFQPPRGARRSRPRSRAGSSGAGSTSAPVAVERAPAEVLIVRASPTGGAAHLGRGGKTPFDQTRRGNDAAVRSEAFAAGDAARRPGPGPLSPGPSPRRRPRGHGELFAGSTLLTGRDQGPSGSDPRLHPGSSRTRSTFADARPSPGCRRLESCSRRAVVLCSATRAGREPLRPRWSGRISSGSASRSTSGRSICGARQARPVGTGGSILDTGKLRTAVEKLKKDLYSQAVVWVEGRHLPQQLELSEGLKRRV